MPISITMPVLGLTMIEGTIQAWLKQVGDAVAKDEPIVAVETDKAVMEVVAPAEGVLGEIVAPEGTRVPVHEIIAYLAAPGEVVVLFSAGKIAGALHSYVGEEAVAAGVGVNLRPNDYIVSTHRGHGHLLAKGGDMNRMMAELYGKVDGYCRGKGGSMHITDVSLGILGANGIVGAGVPIATGADTGIRLQGTDQVVVCFFGDGAANIGTFHEGINLAATWDLPVVFVCENNQYAQFTPQRLHTRVADVYRKAEAYGILGGVVDGNDATEVAAVSAAAIDQARRGQGPILIEAKTFRWYGHAINNPASAIGRDEAEIAAWKAKDPIPRLEGKLLANGLASEAELQAFQVAVAAELDESIRFAEASPSPVPEDALRDVYTELPEGAEL